MKKGLLSACAVLAVVTAAVLIRPAACGADTAQIRAIAGDAYVALYPLVMSYRLMYRQAIDEKSTSYAGGFGKWVHYGAATPDTADISLPSTDTPYSFAWIDVRTEPWVLTMPPVIEGRYYDSQWNDLWGYVLDDPGAIRDGFIGGSYLIVPPGWSGRVPKGIKRTIRGESAFVGTLTRTELLHKGDMPEVKMIQQCYSLKPLSAFLGEQPPKPAPAVAWPAWIEGSERNISFFGYANFLLAFVEPNPADKPLFNRIAAIGIGPGKPWNPDRMSPAMRRALQEGMDDAMKRMAAASERADFSKIFGSRSKLGTDYMSRSLGMLVHAFGKESDHAVYFILDRDDKGEPVDGSRHGYAITFPAGGSPPSRFFWSITIYGLPDRRLVPNPSARYSLGTHSLVLKKAYDGSFTILMQKDHPGKDREMNWLPAPPGRFIAVLRSYGPERDVAGRTWRLPTLMRVE